MLRDEKSSKKVANTYSDNLLFSEDDNKELNLDNSDNSTIEVYVREVANNLISEVCKRLESESNSP